MTPTVALICILVCSVTVTAAMAPMAVSYSTELRKAETRPGLVPLGLLSALLGIVAVVLWWYYAVSTGQLMLGVIPTVGWVSSMVFKAIVRMCAE